ncbi:hypothetical protein [Corynebacterium ulcerans]|uniref:hypothetical protein n=1 Tax=Corynebacterium ulcerans TaxID=65058 RepID=UPI00056E96C0|nr:hypothetical protein [Corynebacterium ulcerans]
MIAVILAVQATITAYKNGVSKATLAREIAMALPAVFSATAIVAIAAVLGIIIGHYVKTIFVLPVAGIGVAALFIAYFPGFNADIESDYAKSYGYTHCTTGTTPTVCTTEPNVPYLKSAANAAHQLYEQAPNSDVLPDTINLINNSFWPLPKPMAAIGLSKDRTWNADTAINNALQSLAQTIFMSCPGLSIASIHQAVGIETGLTEDTIDPTEIRDCLSSFENER